MSRLESLVRMDNVDRAPDVLLRKSLMRVLLLCDHLGDIGFLLSVLSAPSMASGKHRMLLNDLLFAHEDFIFPPTRE